MNSLNAVATLYEGHYSLGVGALINSLNEAHFEGIVMVGFRGELPIWINQLTKLDTDNCYSLNNRINIKFHQIEGDMHLTFVKPYFVKKIFDDNPNIQNIFYFDPDIVVNAPWTFYEDWVSKGMCLCLDTCFAILPSSHPWRYEWLKLGQKTTISPASNYYVNAGFLGIKRSQLEIIDNWIVLTNRFKAQGGDVTKFTKGDHLAFRSDQEILNAVLTCFPDLGYSIIGTEGMGFTYPAYLMSHAVGGQKKPWIKNSVYELIRYGKRLTYNEKRFFENCNGPIQIFNPFKLKMKLLNVKITLLLGRLIGN